jgi:hypothetical protein
MELLRAIDSALTGFAWLALVVFLFVMFGPF